VVDVIEGEAIEVEPTRAVVPVQPGQAIVSSGASGPTDMLAQATAIASALSAMVDKQHLFTTISGKKYPQVEAWMTIGRMDNVVAREAERPTRDEDGSWTAEVELVRLSDGMVIGRASAMCGAKGDRPWDSRPDHQRRSMAVTRATSRAFRQQYSWIMALAGYEPTPADEMPHTESEPPSETDGRYHGAANRTTHNDGLVGKAIAQGNQDFELRLNEKGYVLPFRLKEGRLPQIVIAEGQLAEVLAEQKADVLDKRVTVWGHYTDESFDKKNKDTGEVETIRYKVLHLERIQTADWTLPAEGFDPSESARIDAEAAAAG
jgi:hypothetical protein